MEKGKADRGLGITARLWDSSLIQNSASEGFQIGQRSEMKGAITMKKLMIAATAAFCATVGLAIESANIVGYHTTTVAKGAMVALGLQFKDVGATTKEIPVKSLLTVDVPKTGTGANALTDQIHVWTGTNWKKYYNRKNVGWVCVDQADLTVETTDTVKLGDGVFFKRPGSAAANLTLTGEVVVNDGVDSIEVGKGKMVFVAYPWPTDLAIATFYENIDVPKAGTGANALTDQVHVWTGTNWKKYFHSKSLGGYVAVDQVGELTTDKISAGTCFFFKRPGSAVATLTFKKPAGL